MATVKRYRSDAVSGKEVMLLNAATEMMTRRSYMSQLGMSFNGARDLYEALGYPKSLTYADYIVRYQRQDIAGRIIDAPVDGCWSKMPLIQETDKKEDTVFEKEVSDLIKRTSLFPKLVRLDKLCGLGHFAVLFLGFAGANQQELANPAPSKGKLLYVVPFGEGDIEIIDWESDVTNERYGKPLIYQLTMNSLNGKAKTTTTVRVHFTRVLHVSEGNLDDDVRGEPRLRRVYNRLSDLEKVVGGSGEMFWQGAFPGMALKADAETNMPLPGSVESTAITTEIDNYVHKLKRYMKLQGVDVQQLNPTVADPSKHVDINVSMISAATNIPKRILLGSERGELASSQDADAWDIFLAQRQQDFCTDVVLRPLIDKLIIIGVLSTPANSEYQIVWPPLFEQSEGKKADIASKRAEALSKYVTGQLDALMTFEAFLLHVCGYDDSTAELILASGAEVERQIQRGAREGEEEEEGDLSNNMSPLWNEICRDPKRAPTGGQFSSCGGAGASQKDGVWYGGDGSKLPEKYQAALKGVTIPPGWTDIEVNSDPTGSPLVRGKDKKGRPVSATNPAIAEIGRHQKWARNDAFRAVAPTLARGAHQGTLKGDGDAAAILLTMKTGMRPGSNKDTKGSVKAYGVSTMLGKHVTVEKDGSIHFQFTGKKGVLQDHVIKSPSLAKFIKDRNLGPDDSVFGTTDSKMRAFVKKTTGDSSFKTKDIRTWRATVTATRLIAKAEKPATKKANGTVRRQVADSVSRILGNRPAEALKSYINPRVFAEWEF